MGSEIFSFFWTQKIHKIHKAHNQRFKKDQKVFLRQTKEQKGQELKILQNAKFSDSMDIVPDE
jgi:hypothetical protein